MRPAQRPQELRAGVEANLTSLGLDRIGLVNLRRMDAAPGIPLEADQVVGLDDQLAEMTGAARRGQDRRDRDEHRDPGRAAPCDDAERHRTSPDR
ncbi:hypothetical protein GCM10010446_60690 [Streptomyces enissocaesilis]|uniref:Uncharacterized protein n=1 Tax=Streptomyces enissocaesilis TaxID=332589 RepID=A0ABN3XLP1_9ACTN